MRLQVLEYLDTIYHCAYFKHASQQVSFTKMCFKSVYFNYYFRFLSQTLDGFVLF